MDSNVAVLEPPAVQETAEVPAPAHVVVEESAEPRWRRSVYLALALAFTAGYAFFLLSFCAPAPGRIGVDENAYLVSGRMVAEHGTTGFKPADPYQFVGAMWVLSDNGSYYPKYPFGTSLLNSIPVLLHHPEWAFWISPICMALAALGMFFLARAIVGSFYGLLAMIVLAMGPTTLQLAPEPNSHGAALFFVVWGMMLLMLWWRSGRWWIGAAGGLMLGYAVTIRYTEALLMFPFYALDVVRTDQFIGPKAHAIFRVLAVLPVGPIGIAALSRVKWNAWRSYVSAAVPAIAWAVPVAALVIYNHFTLGHLTGYDSTNESSGFSLEYLVDKWQFAINQVTVIGLFVFSPLAVAGLALMYRQNWRMALALTMWFVPGAFLYAAYYWGEHVPGVWYLRFFLTLFPPLILAAMFFLRRIREPGKRSIVAPLAAGVLTAGMASVGLWVSLGHLIREHRGDMNLHYTAREIISHIEPAKGGKPVILADKGMFPNLLMYMQFMYDADWYASDIFAIRAGGGFGLAGVFDRDSSKENRPTGLQRKRIDYIDAFRKGKKNSDFINDAHHVFDQALDANRRVYVVMEPGESNYFRNRFITKAYEMKQVNRWNEPCAIRFDLPGDHSELAAGTIGNSPFLPWAPRRWEMFEIRRTGD